MMDAIAQITVIVVVAFVFVFSSLSFGNDKTSSLPLTSKGWQKNRKKNNRSKKLKKVQTTQKKIHTRAASQDAEVEAPLSDVEAPSLPLQIVSSDIFEDDFFDGPSESMSDHSSVADSYCEPVHAGSVMKNMITDVEERGLLMSEAEVSILSEKSNSNDSAGADAIHIMNGTSVGLQQESEHACEACKNSDVYYWGCPLHRTYTSALLLAHRELRFGAAQKPVDINLRLVSRNSHVYCPK
jgi:hypothetical protein